MTDREPIRTRGGYLLGEVSSALQKSVRQGDERQALKWMAILADGQVFYAWRRLLTIAAEDIGFGDVQAVTTVNALHASWLAARSKSEHLTLHSLAFATMLLCRATKSTEVEDALSLTSLELWEDGDLPEIPAAALDVHSQRGRARGRDDADWYAQRHDEFRIPTNAYTALLARRCPIWFSKVSEETRKALGLEDGPGFTGARKTP